MLVSYYVCDYLCCVPQSVTVLMTVRDVVIYTCRMLINSGRAAIARWLTHTGTVSVVAAELLVLYNVPLCEELPHSATHGG